jgi:hypothetical protein
LTLQSIAAGVPFNGKTSQLFFGTTTVSGSGYYFPNITGDSTGTGGESRSIVLAGGTHTMPNGIPAQSSSTTFNVMLITAQTIYWMDSGTGTNESLYVLGYGF